MQTHALACGRPLLGDWIINAGLLTNYMNLPYVMQQVIENIIKNRIKQNNTFKCIHYSLLVYIKCMHKLAHSESSSS